MDGIIVPVRKAIQMKRLLSLGASLLIAAPLYAQSVPGTSAAAAPTGGANDDAITVTANGYALPISQAGQSISVIGALELKSIQGPDLTRVLERLPGVSFARNGGIGSTTSLFVRGASSEQLLVIIDGVRVNDTAAPSGGYDLGNLLNDGLGKVELLRGSNSVVWGSQAIGGVLSITSRELNGVEASGQYGARNTFDGQVNAGITRDRYAVTLNGGYTRTDGVSAAAAGTERDGYDQYRIGGRGRFDLTDSLSLIANARYARSKLDIDGFAPPTYAVFADTDDVQLTHEVSALGGLRYTSDSLSLTAAYTINDIRRRYTGESYDPFPYETKGLSQRAELFGVWTIRGPVRLDFGGENEWSRFSDSYDTRKRARLASGHVLLGYYGDRFTIAGGARIDDHSRFGTKGTFAGNASYRVIGDWRVRASYSEGFKVPTLYQLFSNYGNEQLRPERSRSYDAGIEYGDRNGALYFALTGFRRDSRNLIDFAYCSSPTSAPLCADGRFGFYDNVGRARATGAELELGAQVSPNLRAQAVYTYVKSVNRTVGDANFGNDLARRPRNALTVTVDWTPDISLARGLTLGGDVRMVSNSFNDAANLTRLKGYPLVTLRASVPLIDQLDLFARVENLADRDYRTVAGYGTAGRSGFVGLRARI